MYSGTNRLTLWPYLPKIFFFLIQDGFYSKLITVQIYSSILEDYFLKVSAFYLNCLLKKFCQLLSHILQSGLIYLAPLYLYTYKINIIRIGFLFAKNPDFFLIWRKQFRVCKKSGLFTVFWGKILPMQKIRTFCVFGQK